MMEVFLENSRKVLDIFEKSEPIPDVYIPNYNIFIRMIAIHNMHSYSTKFTLEQGIRLYEKDSEIEKVPLFNAFKKISLANVELICNFMLYKMKDWNVSSISEELSTAMRGPLNRQPVLPWTNLDLKLNSNLDLQFQTGPESLSVNKLLIYRNVLSLKPLQIASIVYYQKKDSFEVYMYDVDYSWVLKKRINIDVVKASVPYVEKMLQLKLYEELGERIYKAFKNRLLHYSYVKKTLSRKEKELKA